MPFFGPFFKAIESPPRDVSEAGDEQNQGPDQLRVNRSEDTIDDTCGSEYSDRPTTSLLIKYFEEMAKVGDRDKVWKCNIEDGCEYVFAQPVEEDMSEHIHDLHHDVYVREIRSAGLGAVPKRRSKRKRGTIKYQCSD